MSHLHVVGRDSESSAPIVSSSRRARRLGDVGNLLAEYARLRNSPNSDYSRRACFITAWRWRRIWRGVPMPKAKTHSFPLYDFDGGDAA